jgi:membrane associated rhomboid family serine protease
VGASGAVYGLFFFCIIDITLQILTSDDSREKVVQYLITCLIIPYFIMSVFFTVDISGRTDHAAHIGGIIMGILVAIYLCKMPEFITRRISNVEERIRSIAFISIVSYFFLTLFIFYFFLPVTLK